MKRTALLIAALCLPLLASEEKGDRSHDKSEPPEGAGIHWTRDARPAGSARTSGNMTYHNGRIMTTAVIKSIFWGTSWEPTTVTR